ncbi:MAG: EAL domain-containing protein [Rhodospirillales bacterium]|nr:EAL domain-containing protein [Rhodospirillales bacterium]
MLQHESIAEDLARQFHEDGVDLDGMAQVLRGSLAKRCFHQVIESVVDSVVLHRDGCVIYANASAVRTIGARTQRNLIGKPSLGFVAPEDKARVGKAIEQVMATGCSSGIVPYTGVRFDGRRVEVETIAVRIATAAAPTILTVCRDVTERNRTKLALKESEARFETMARLSPEAIIAVCDDRIELANAAAAALFGVACADELEGCALLPFCAEGQCGLEALGLASDGCAAPVPRQASVLFRRFDGAPIDLEVTSIPCIYEEKPRAYLFLRDVTERLRAEQHHRYLASHDPLTDLPNRLEFQRRLRALLSRRHAAEGGRFAIHYLDLDYFKTINDSLGHDIGDRLLQLVAARLRSTIRATDVVARLGGDEFAVLQTDANVTDAPRALAQKLQRAVEQPYTVGDQLLHTSATIGIAISPDHGLDPDLLLRRADLALYHAKACGRNAIRFFSRDLDVRVRERDSLINQLIRAEARDEFEVHFQPIASLTSGRIEAVEALLRWRHPERGLMTAEDFIHAIEASRESQRIGAWVLRQACEQAKTWEKAGVGHLRVAVNLSMPFLQRPDFTDVVLGILRQTGLDASKLELELTERMVITAGSAGIAPKLAGLRRHGVHITLDDFGTGYSSLALLRDLPVDRIKIDRSFVAGFGSSADDTAIVRAVTHLGRSLNKRVTAEGVESSETMDRLRDEGCHDVQGYHLARPMPASMILDFLRRTGDGPDPSRA